MSIWKCQIQKHYRLLNKYWMKWRSKISILKFSNLNRNLSISSIHRFQIIWKISKIEIWFQSFRLNTQRKHIIVNKTSKLYFKKIVLLIFFHVKFQRNTWKFYFKKIWSISIDIKQRQFLFRRRRLAKFDDKILIDYCFKYFKKHHNPLNFDIYALIDSMTFQIWLSTQICDVLKRNFELIYDFKTNLYLMNDIIREKFFELKFIFTFKLENVDFEKNFANINFSYFAFD